LSATSTIKQKSKTSLRECFLNGKEGACHIDVKGVEQYQKKIAGKMAALL